MTKTNTATYYVHITITEHNTEVRNAHTMMTIHNA